MIFSRNRPWLLGCGRGGISISIHERERERECEGEEIQRKKGKENIERENIQRNINTNK